MKKGISWLFTAERVAPFLGGGSGGAAALFCFALFCFFIQPLMERGH